jgi:hypothetical protein
MELPLAVGLNKKNENRYRRATSDAGDQAADIAMRVLPDAIPQVRHDPIVVEAKTKHNFIFAPLNRT